jgi:hypothetical protein
MRAASAVRKPAIANRLISLDETLGAGSQMRHKSGKFKMLRTGARDSGPVYKVRCARAPVAEPLG